MAYKPWTYASFEELRARRQDQFRQRAAQERADRQAQETIGQAFDRRMAARPPVSANHPSWRNPLGLDMAGRPAWQPPADSGGGGIFGKLEDVAGGALEKVGEAFQYPYEHGGKQTLGVITGAKGMERKPIYDEQGNITGYKREGGQNVLDWLGNVAESARHPGAAGEAYQEYTKSLPWAGRIAAETVANPINYVTGPLASKLVPGAGVLARGARALLDQGGGGAVLGGAYGSDLGARWAPDRLKPYAGLAGGVVGGGIGGALTAGAKRLKLPEKAAENVKQAASQGFGNIIRYTGEAEDKYIVALAKHDIGYEFAGPAHDPVIKVTDLDRLYQTMDQLDPSSEDFKLLSQIDDSQIHNPRVSRSQPIEGRAHNLPLLDEQTRQGYEGTVAQYQGSRKKADRELRASIESELGRDDAYRAVSDAWAQIHDVGTLENHIQQTIARFVRENPGVAGARAMDRPRAKAYLAALEDLHNNFDDYAAEMMAGAKPEAGTVKRPDLFGNVHDTFQTESELNGWRASQGGMPLESAAPGGEAQAGFSHSPEPTPGSTPFALPRGSIEQERAARRAAREAAGLAPAESDFQTRQEWGKALDEWRQRQYQQKEAERAASEAERGARQGPAPDMNEPFRPKGSRSRSRGKSTRDSGKQAEPSTADGGSSQSAEGGPSPTGGETGPDSASQQAKALPELDDSNDWTIFDLPPGTTPTDAEVKAAYLRKIRQYHPDMGGNTADAQALNAAYQRWRAGNPLRDNPRSRFKAAREEAARDSNGRQQRDEGMAGAGSRNQRDGMGDMGGNRQQAGSSTGGYRAPGEGPEAGRTSGDAGATGSASDTGPQGPRAQGAGAANRSGQQGAGSAYGPGRAQPPGGSPPGGPAGPGTSGSGIPYGAPRPQPHDIFRTAALGRDVASKMRAAAQAIRARGRQPKLTIDATLDRAFTAARQAYNRIQNTRSSFGEQVDLLRHQAERAGLKIKAQKVTNATTGDVEIHFVLPDQGGVSIEDLATRRRPNDPRLDPNFGTLNPSEQAQKFATYQNAMQSYSQAVAEWAKLTPDQRAVFTKLDQIMQDANDTIAAHGGDLHLDPDVEGVYWPKIVISHDGKLRAVNGAGPNNPSFGRTMGHNRANVFDSVAEGIKAGYNYEDPWVALRLGIDGKLRTAQDAYFENLLKPLARAGEQSPWGVRELRDSPALRSSVFDEDVANRVEKLFARPGDNALTRVPRTINAVLTPLRAGFDFSASLQQGMGFAIRHPLKATEYMTKAMAAIGHPDTYYKTIRNLDAQGPGVQRLMELGWKMRGMGGEELQWPQLAQMLSRGKVREIPGLAGAARGFNRNFAGLLNMESLHEANNLYARLAKKGLSQADFEKEVAGGLNSVNRMFGWTPTRPSQLESTLVFAPRYTRATIEQIATAFTKGGMEGSMARKHLASLAIGGALVAYVANQARGYATDFDPRSSNFLRIRNVGGLDISPFGTYDTLVRGAAGLLFGEEGDPLNPLESLNPGRAGKFAEAKFSPAVKLLWEGIHQESFTGEPLEPTKGLAGAANFARAQAQSSLPFTIQNLWQEGPAAAAVGATGLSNNPLTHAERRDFRRDAVANDKFGKNYDELTGEQKSQVNEDSQVAQEDRLNRERQMQRTGDFANYARITTTTRDQLAAAGQMFQSGKYSGNQYRDAVGDIAQRRLGAMSTIPEFKSDPELAGWFHLYDQAKRADGSIDYDKLDPLQAAYEKDHPGVTKKVDAIVGANDDPVMRQYRAAKAQAQEYYAIPRYRRMSVEDGDLAASYIAMANDLVSFGQAKDRAHAIRMVSRQYPGAGRLIRRAQERGLNPARKRFRASHPEYAAFYSDAPTTLAG